MKPLALAAVFLFAVLLTGCTSSSPAATAPATVTPSVPASASIAALECQTDSDCIVAGCSGQICQPKSREPAITTCEFKDEYACYKPEGCLCQSGQCAWSAETVQCIRDSNAPAGQTEAEFKCVQSCREWRARGLDLSNGPCLSNAIAPGWVCDVAHWPRQDVDNLPEKTCPAFGETAQHFVEVDTDCQLIQSS